MATAKVARQYDLDDVDDDEKYYYWAQLAIHHVASLFRKNGKMDFATLSEFDMLTGPWQLLFTCCMGSLIDVRGGEISSLSSSNSKDHNRHTITEEQERYRVGAKVDGLYVTGMHELGTIEAGTTVGDNSTK